MAKKIWTAAELEALTPSEQDEIFESSLVHDPADVPPEFLARVRDRARQRIAENETPHR